MAGLGHSVGQLYGWIVHPGCQVKHGASTVLVLAMRQTVAGAVGLEGLAGCSPEFFRSLCQVTGGYLPLGVVQHLMGQSGVLLGEGLVGLHDDLSRRFS